MTYSTVAAIRVGPQSDAGCFAPISSGSMQQPSFTFGLAGEMMTGGSGVPKARRGRPSRASIHNRLAEEVNELRQRIGGLPLPRRGFQAIRPVDGAGASRRWL
jgi:hypothetical protein